jgi:hypothetical protein
MNGANLRKEIRTSLSIFSICVKDAVLLLPWKMSWAHIDLLRFGWAWVSLYYT